MMCLSGGLLVCMHFDYNVVSSISYVLFIGVVERTEWRHKQYWQMSAAPTVAQKI
jgi:hypothetical protein